MLPKKDEQYSDAEAALRRDEVIRRMANTPPQPKPTVPARHPKTKKKAAVPRVADKGHGGRAR